MTTIDTDAVAADLLAAYATGKTLDPLTTTYPSITVDDSYAIQQRQTESRLQAGARIVGYKVGLTSLAMQQQLGVDQPDFGHLLTAWSRGRRAHRRPVASCSRGPSPRSPSCSAKPLRGPGVTVADVAARSTYVLPAMEIIDSRIADWKITPERHHRRQRAPAAAGLGSTPDRRCTALDLSLLGCVLHRNGRMVQTGAGARRARLAGQRAAVWLANMLAAPRRRRSSAGHVILPGSVTAAVPVQAGDTITATFDRLGSVTAVFD